MDTARTLRPAARILLMDRHDRILLFRFDPDDRQPFWCTPGGALDPGESYVTAARRELLEETGIDASPGREVARKLAEFVTIEGVPVIADERYFAVRINVDGNSPGVIDVSRHTLLEQQVMRSWAWFDANGLAALPESYFPQDLPALVRASLGDLSRAAWPSSSV